MIVKYGLISVLSFPLEFVEDVLIPEVVDG